MANSNDHSFVPLALRHNPLHELNDFSEITPEILSKTPMESSYYVNWESTYAKELFESKDPNNLGYSVDKIPFYEQILADIKKKDALLDKMFDEIVNLDGNFDENAITDDEWERIAIYDEARHQLEPLPYTALDYLETLLYFNKTTSKPEF